MPGLRPQYNWNTSLRLARFCPKEHTYTHAQSFNVILTSLSSEMYTQTHTCSPNALSKLNKKSKYLFYLSITQTMYNSISENVSLILILRPIFLCPFPRILYMLSTHSPQAHCKFTRLGDIEQTIFLDGFVIHEVLDFRGGAVHIGILK